MNTQTAKEILELVIQETHDAHIRLADVYDGAHAGTMLWADLQEIHTALHYFVYIHDLLRPVLAHLTQPQPAGEP